MPATATRPAHPRIGSCAAGICAAEADLITAAARRFLERAEASFHEIAMAAISDQTGALFDPYTPLAVEDYSCVKSYNGLDKIGTHYCATS